MCFEEHLSFKFFLTIAFVREISAKESGGFGCDRRERVKGCYYPVPPTVGPRLKFCVRKKKEFKYLLGSFFINIERVSTTEESVYLNICSVEILHDF